MASHRTRVGVHARNDVRFTDGDYQLVRQARIETLVTMSHTDAGVYQRLRSEFPNLELIVRLFDDRVRNRSRPDPGSFVERMVPVIQRLKPYATKFEIHNEPNHADGIEGWGASDADARAFLPWYMHVLQGLKKACPWAKFGFPGLALNWPHRDLEWLSICQEAVRASDWLGCHCFWQYDNMLSDDWGLRFKLYRQRFPGKAIEITEFGNSTPNLSPDEMARQYVRYYQELNRYFYLGSASAFIASSPDPAWAPFAWMRGTGQMMPVVQAVGAMERKAVETVSERTFPKTGKKVRGSFLALYDRLGSEICGNPITDQFSEKDIPVQYFERLAMEEPKAGQPRLRTAGSEAWNARAEITRLQGVVDKLTAQPLPSVEALIDQLSDLAEKLVAKIQVLQQELARAQMSAPPAGTVQALLLNTLPKQTSDLLKLSDELHTDLAAALKRMGESEAALIEQLQARIKALEAGTGKQTEPLPSPAPAPVPAPSPAPSGAGKPAMQNIVDQLPEHATARYPSRSLSDIRLLVIHHSATPANTTPESIARYHVDHWQWPGIGYHFVIAANGTIYQTNELETISNHAAGSNTAGVGMCFIGSFMDAPPPAVQIHAGATLIAWLLKELHLSLDAVKGHRELMQTACPGDQWQSGAEWKKALLQEIGKIQGGTS
jgi:hypothetical protein